MSTSPAKERKLGRTIMSRAFVTGSREAVRRAVFKDFVVLMAVPKPVNDYDTVWEIDDDDNLITYYGAHPDFDALPEDYKPSETPFYDVYFNEEGEAYFKRKV